MIDPTHHRCDSCGRETEFLFRFSRRSEDVACTEDICVACLEVGLLAVQKVPTAAVDDQFAKMLKALKGKVREKPGDSGDQLEDGSLSIP